MEVKKYEIKARRSDGYAFSYENEDWAILKVSGIDFPEIEVFSEPKGIGDGDIITGRRRQPREIEITCALRSFDEKRYKECRNQAIGFHNIKHSYDVAITYLGTTMIAKDCVIKAASYPSTRHRVNSKMTILMFSPEADLFASNANNIGFILTIPEWHDTRIYQGAGSLIFGKISKATEKVINYLGTEDAPITATIKATGFVDGITIGIGNKMVSVMTQLHEGDVLVIDTGKRMITLNGTPVPLTDYDATALIALVLIYGDNVVTIKSASNAFTAEVDYIGKYGGL